MVGAAGEQTTCPACLEDISGGSATPVTMECGHAGCRDCWLQHIQVNISEARACQLPCMAYKCKTICSHRYGAHRQSCCCALLHRQWATGLLGDTCRIVETLLRASDPGLLHKYQCAILNSYIEDNANVRWCPSVPCCGRAIEALDDGYCEPKCECGLQFCFKCGLKPHSPSTCSMWQEWEAKMGDDMTNNYLKVRTTHVLTCHCCSSPGPLSSCAVQESLSALYCITGLKS
jgi:ariadne-1